LDSLQGLLLRGERRKGSGAEGVDEGKGKGEGRGGKGP